MPTYATADDVAEWIGTAPGGVSDEQLNRIIVKAERQIDALLTITTPTPGPGGLKVTPSELAPALRTRLTTAVAAQVEYRLTMGEDFFVRDQSQSVKGPDFTVTGTLDRIGPEAREQLDGSGLTDAIAGGSGSWGRLVP